MDFLLGMVVLILQATLTGIVYLVIPCIIFAKVWFMVEKRITGRKQSVSKGKAGDGYVKMKIQKVS
jgi:hypothetical protein